MCATSRCPRSSAARSDRRHQVHALLCAACNRNDGRSDVRVALRTIIFIDSSTAASEDVSPDVGEHPVTVARGRVQAHLFLTRVPTDPPPRRLELDTANWKIASNQKLFRDMSAPGS
jgi:hypothetical protein